MIKDEDIIDGVGEQDIPQAPSVDATKGMRETVAIEKAV